MAQEKPAPKKSMDEVVDIAFAKHQQGAYTSTKPNSTTAATAMIESAVVVDNRKNVSKLSSKKRKAPTPTPTVEKDDPSLWADSQVIPDSDVSDDEPEPPKKKKVKKPAISPATISDSEDDDDATDA